MTVSVVAYAQAWPQDFAEVRGQLRAALEDGAMQIEHIGSTSVAGLCAKPVIDVLVGAQSLASVEAAIPRLAVDGFAYVSKYELELPLRRYFVRPQSRGPRVHAHAVCRDSAFWREQLAFRDALRADARLRQAYAQLKLELARTHENDKGTYTAAKAPFIWQVLASLGDVPGRCVA